MLDLRILKELLKAEPSTLRARYKRAVGAERYNSEAQQLSRASLTLGILEHEFHVIGLQTTEIELETERYSS